MHDVFYLLVSRILCNERPAWRTVVVDRGAIVSLLSVGPTVFPISNWRGTAGVHLLSNSSEIGDQN